MVDFTSILPVKWPRVRMVSRPRHSKLILTTELFKLVRIHVSIPGFEPTPIAKTLRTKKGKYSTGRLFILRKRELRKAG